MSNFDKSQILDPDWIITSLTSTSTVNNPYSMVLVNTSSGAVTITLGEDVKGIRIKDLGSADKNPITVVPSSGKTMNGDSNEVIDKKNAWVYYVLVGTSYTTLMGGF